MKEGHKDFKYNFLREIIVRVEYLGITDTDVDAAIQELRPILKKAGYNRYITPEDAFSQRKKEARTDFGDDGDNTLRRHTFELHDHADIVLIFTCQALTLHIRKKYHVRFVQYMEAIANSLKELKKQTEFFAIRTAIIRKVNVCYLRDITALHQYFSKSFFSVLDFTLANKPVFTAQDIYTHDPYICRVQRRVDFGKRKGEDVSRVLMITDIRYESDLNNDSSQDIENIIKQHFSKMNDITYHIYVKSLACSFKKQLKQIPYQKDECIIGVEPNDDVKAE